MSTRPLLLLAFLVYVAVDLGCPFVPGAFSFDPQQCVDGVSRHRDRGEPVVVAPVAPAAVVIRTVPRRPHVSRADGRDRRRPFHHARDHAAAFVDAPSVDDH